MGLDLNYLSHALDREVRSTHPVSGGDVAQSYRVEFSDSSTVFAKTHANPPPRFFTTEASGLSWLRASSTVPVPEVLAVSDDPPLLVLEWIDESREATASRSGEIQLGVALAQLHMSGAEHFGRADRRTTGSRALPNEPCETWSEFYATQRLLPLAKIASTAGALPDQLIANLEAIAGRLESLGGPPEPPSRLHGDLWAGNRLVDSRGRSWLIDPASHGGHREFDLAMMRLFGGFGPECFDAYEEAWPLADGWADRVALHQLAPLVVHAIKFGGGYVSATESALASFS